jgi:hypothetical protein
MLEMQSVLLKVPNEESSEAIRSPICVIQMAFILCIIQMYQFYDIAVIFVYFLIMRFECYSIIVKSLR